MSGKKFRFSLQKVLELRRHETERARQALTEAESVLETRREELQQARRRLADCRSSVANGQTLRPATLRKEAAFREDARRAVATARAAVADAHERVANARDRLQERRRAEEALETLREQEQAKHEKEQAKAETAFLDEQAVLRHARTNPMSLMP